MGVVWTFFSHLSFLSSFSLSLGDGPIWTEILSQRAVKPKINQPTNPLSNRLYSKIGVLRSPGGGRVVGWCWVNFQCRGVLLIWIIVWQGLTALAVGAGGGCLDFFSLVYHFSLLSPSLWETARYRLKYCLKGPLSPKQPTNQPTYVPGGGQVVRRVPGVLLIWII